MNTINTYALNSYISLLNIKYSKLLKNQWFWCVFALLVLASFIGYAVYCTSKGYNFSGNIKLNWPKVWEMGIGCKKK